MIKVIKEHFESDRYGNEIKGTYWFQTDFMDPLSAINYVFKIRDEWEAHCWGDYEYRYYIALDEDYPRGEGNYEVVTVKFEEVE